MPLSSWPNGLVLRSLRQQADQTEKETCCTSTSRTSSTEEREQVRDHRRLKNKARDLAKNQSTGLEKRLRRLERKTSTCLKKIHAVFLKHKLLWPCIFFSGCPEITGLLILTSFRLWISMRVCASVAGSEQQYGGLETVGREWEEQASIN